METGQLAKHAKMHVKFGGTIVEKHPISRVCFHDIRLPYWDQIPHLLERGMEALKPLKYLGWDIAFTTTGPVLMEASTDHDLFVFQSAIGGLRQTEIGKAAISAR
jgi:hypothetical protein